MMMTTTISVVMAAARSERKEEGKKNCAQAQKTKKKKKVKKVKPKKIHDDPRRKTGRWSEEEEKLFLEALELYGRDWNKCVEHMNHSRDRGGFTSHAQKHFIRLYQQDKPLPLKVQETGEGYTLSGKPLDPNSAAARAYGLQGAAGKKMYREGIADSSATKNTDKLGNSKITSGDAVTNSQKVTKKVYYVWRESSERSHKGARAHSWDRCVVHVVR